MQSYTEKINTKNYIHRYLQMKFEKAVIGSSFEGHKFVDFS